MPEEDVDFGVMHLIEDDTETETPFQGGNPDDNVPDPVKQYDRLRSLLNGGGRTRRDLVNLQRAILVMDGMFNRKMNAIYKQEMYSPDGIYAHLVQAETVRDDWQRWNSIRDVLHYWFAVISGQMRNEPSLWLHMAVQNHRQYERCRNLANNGVLDRDSLENLKDSLRTMHDMIARRYGGSETDTTYMKESHALQIHFRKAELIPGEEERIGRMWNLCVKWFSLISGARTSQGELWPTVTIVDEDSVTSVTAGFRPDGRIIDPSNGETSGSWFLDHIALRENRGRPVSIAFLGEPGSGKSSAAIRLGAALDPNFSVDNIVFNVEDYLHLINTLPEHSVLIFDDAGVGLANRDWRTKQVKLFGKVAQTVRHKNFVHIFTVPNALFIELQSRSLMQFELQALSQKGRFKLKRIIPSKIRGERDTWGIILRNKEFSESSPPLVVEHRFINFEKPPARIFDIYEQRKHDWLHDFYEEGEKGDQEDGQDANAPVPGQQQAQPVERVIVDPAKTEMGVLLQCRHDGHEFWHEERIAATACPKCGGSVVVPEKLRPMTGKEHPALPRAYYEKFFPQTVSGGAE